MRLSAVRFSARRVTRSVVRLCCVLTSICAQGYAAGAAGSSRCVRCSAGTFSFRNNVTGAALKCLCLIARRRTDGVLCLRCRHLCTLLWAKRLFVMCWCALFSELNDICRVSSAGYYSDNPAMTACASCSNNSISMSPGSSNCSFCPTNAHSDFSGRRCVCSAGMPSKFLAQLSTLPAGFYKVFDATSPLQFGCRFGT